jgi:hypothetical protein
MCRLLSVTTGLHKVWRDAWLTATRVRPPRSTGTDANPSHATARSRNALHICLSMTQRPERHTICRAICFGIHAKLKLESATIAYEAPHFVPRVSSSAAGLRVTTDEDVSSSQDLEGTLRVRTELTARRQSFLHIVFGFKERAYPFKF